MNWRRSESVGSGERNKDAIKRVRSKGVFYSIRPVWSRWRDTGRNGAPDLGGLLSPSKAWGCEGKSSN